MAVDGGWRQLVVGDWWLMVVSNGWRLAVGGGWRLGAVGGWGQWAVGGWWRLVSVGGWWLAVDGPLGRSLRAVLNKKKISVPKDRPAATNVNCFWVGVAGILNPMCSKQCPISSVPCSKLSVPYYPFGHPSERLCTCGSTHCIPQLAKREEGANLCGGDPTATMQFVRPSEKCLGPLASSEGASPLNNTRSGCQHA